MDRYLTWSLVSLIVWCMFLLHIFTVANTGPHPVLATVGTYLICVAIPTVLGVRYGMSIRKEGEQ